MLSTSLLKTTVWVKKFIPRGFLNFFHNGWDFKQNFTPPLYVDIYAKLRNFIQLSLNMTKLSLNVIKLCHIKHTIQWISLFTRILEINGHQWRVQGVMNGWLLVFLSRMCCHKASWAVIRLVAFQGVRRKPCTLSPFGGNFWPCLSRVKFFTLRS